jgi:flagellar protein FlgJ
LYKVCQEFEAIFIKQMLDVMRSTVPKTGLLDGGMAEEIFEDMLYDEYAKSMSENAGFGLSDIIYDQLSGELPRAPLSGALSAYRVPDASESSTGA